MTALRVVLCAVYCILASALLMVPPLKFPSLPSPIPARSLPHIIASSLPPLVPSHPPFAPCLPPAILPRSFPASLPPAIQLSHCRSIFILDTCSPIMWSVFFRENAPVAILAADSKRYCWAAWTVMKNSRSQFAWHCAQVKESAIRRVESGLPVHVVLVPPLLHLQALVPGLQRQPHHHCCGGFEKSSGFYSCRQRHCQVDASSLVCLQHRRHTGADIYPTDSSQ